ncbi:MAG: hypothetical protein JXA75_06890 [Candidatus Thermoplasmatota archaeon]|nr:hypothetical protein [Candidatus Thermoplasmatota archaeon]
MTQHSTETTSIVGFIFNASDFGDAIVIHSILCLFYKVTVVDDQITKFATIHGPHTIVFIPYQTKEGIIRNHFICATFFY